MTTNDIYVWNISEADNAAAIAPWVGIVSSSVNSDSDHWDKLLLVATQTDSSLVYSDSHDDGITLQPLNPCAPHLDTLPVPCLIATKFWQAALHHVKAKTKEELLGGLWDALCQVACWQGIRMTHLAECTWRTRVEPKENTT